MTKLREEEAKKKKSHQAKEIIEAVGTPGRKGVGYAKEYFKGEKKKAKEEAATDLTKLWSRRKGKLVTYNSLLAELLRKRLLTVNWPLGWMYQVISTSIGVVFEIRSPQERYFRAAFKPTRDPMYDLNAVDVYATRAENTIDRVTGADKALYIPESFSGKRKKPNGQQN